MAPTTTIEHVESGSATLYVEVTGTGPALVLLHAAVADRRSWAGVVEAFAPTHRVIAYDRRGFGDTTYEPESYSDVDDLIAVLDALDVSSAVLIGSSQGGRVAIDAALAHPARVSALVLIAPAVSGTRWPDEWTPEVEALDTAIERASDAGDIDAANELEAHMWLDGPLSEAGRVGGEARALFLDMNRRALTSAPRGERREPEPAYPRLSQLAVPTYVIAGALDVPEMIDLARHIADVVPNAHMTVIEGVAHLPQLEQPDVLNAEVRRAVDRAE